MERFRTWLASEREKVKALPGNERWGYIWSYYKLWMIGILSAAVLLGYGTVHFLTTPGDSWFYACFANTYADVGSDSAFCQGFARYAGYDLREKSLTFDAQCYCTPGENNYGNPYYESLVTMLDSGTLDVLVMEEEDLTAIGSTGRLLDLEDERLDGLAERWKERLVYCIPEEGTGYDKEQVAVGIDLGGTALVGSGSAYPDGAVLGVGALSSRYDQVELFLGYLLEEAES